jgi:hypothetical protein
MAHLANGRSCGITFASTSLPKLLVCPFCHNVVLYITMYGLNSAHVPNFKVVNRCDKLKMIKQVFLILEHNIPSHVKIWNFIFNCPVCTHNMG